MSNYLALATVTATMQQLLSSALREKFPGANVSTLRPEALALAQPQVGVNIYLFQVTPNMPLMNYDLPTRDATGQFTALPQIALNLRYLFTCFGKEDRLEPEKVLAITTIAMNTQPILSREEIDRAVSAVASGGLAGSDLALQPQPVKFSQNPLSLDELHKLWTIFSPTAYRLSMVYEASVVLLDPVISRRQNLPVRSIPRLAQTTSPLPTLQEIVPSRLVYSPSAVIRLKGRNLASSGATGSELAVAIGGLDARILTASPTTLEVALPTGIPAGVLPVTVSRTMALGEPAVPHTLPGSEMLSLVLQPSVTRASVSSRIDPRSGAEILALSITPRPAPQVGQRSEILINAKAAPGEASRAFSCSSLLSFSMRAIPGNIASGETVPENVRGGFQANGITVSSAATIEWEDGPTFRIVDHATQQVYQVEPGELSWVVYFGLVAGDPIETIVFQLPPIPAGSYLVRYRVGPVESPLTVDPVTGVYVGPEVTVA
jgi:Pvc16 N-terminal domain